MSQSDAVNLFARIWPPVGLTVGAVATVAWGLFLAYQALVLVGLAF